MKANEKKPIKYSGEVKFRPIFEFLNVYSEVFVAGGGSSSGSAASKEWLSESVPEMNIFSAGDICLKVEGTLCVIILSSGKPNKDVIEIFKDLNRFYERKIDRGN